MLNKYLSYYQITGIAFSLTVIAIWAHEESRMAPFFVLFAGLLFLPFSIVSIFSLLDVKWYKRKIQNGIWTGTAFLMIPSYALPFFYEWGGFVISLVCTGIGFSIWINRRHMEKQILIFNIVGSITVTGILLLFIT